MVSKNIEITSRCRLECTKCSRTVLLNKNGSVPIYDISLEDFEKLCKSENLTHFYFGGTMGDCIYHPKFDKIIQIAKSHNIYLTIHTNGSGRPMRWWHNILSLLSSGDEIDIAMDGYKETVGMYRKNFTEKDFEFNIELLKIAKNQYGIDVKWTFIPMKFNEHQIIDAATLALENNINFVVKKSNRWNSLDDPLLPSNFKLIPAGCKVLQ